MSLHDLLYDRQGPILKRWFDLIAGMRPAEGVPFPRARARDGFGDPEGHTISREIEALYHELLRDKMDMARTCASLEGILRIKAVQDCTEAETLMYCSSGSTTMLALPEHFPRSVTWIVLQLQ